MARSPPRLRTAQSESELVAFLDDCKRERSEAFAEIDMFNTIVGVLLVLVVGMCVVAFPFVLWMLFGDGPRSRHARHTSYRREDRKKAPPRYDEDEE
jgi:hypothetical protein